MTRFERNKMRIGRTMLIVPILALIIYILVLTCKAWGFWNLLVFIGVMAYFCTGITWWLTGIAQLDIEKDPELMYASNKQREYEKKLLDRDLDRLLGGGYAPVIKAKHKIPPKV